MLLMEKRTANHEGGHGSLCFEPLGGLPRQLGQALGAAEDAGRARRARSHGRNTRDKLHSRKTVLAFVSIYEHCPLDPRYRKYSHRKR